MHDLAAAARPDPRAERVDLFMWELNNSPSIGTALATDALPQAGVRMMNTLTLTTVTPEATRLTPAAPRRCSACYKARSHGVDKQPIRSLMPVRFIFRCQFCDAQPDPMTQLSLETAMRENTWGAYQNALPGRWLVFHGRGLYGSPRYACTEHRGDLVAYLRQHFGTIGFHVWKRPPYPSSLAHAETDHAWFAATRRQGGWGS